MLPPSDDCDDCLPSYLKSQFGAKAAFSTLPFCATFVLITVIAYRKVYPLLSAPSKQNAKLPQPVTASLEPSTQTLARRIAALTFSSTIALSAVLTELLLCEISNSFNPTARSVALQVTVASLLGLLVVAIPLLGISSVVSKSGYKFRAEQKGRRRLAWMLEVAGYALFLAGFWLIGSLLPESRTIQDTLKGHKSLFQACLDRLGLTGVSLMALLSGFASVSAIWQNFGPKPKLVADTDITRKQAGLDATIDMIAEKKARLAQIENKISSQQSSANSSKGFWSRTVSNLRGNNNTDIREKQTLEMEVTGLETMSASLDSTLNVLRSRLADQRRSSTKFGRLSIAFSYVFSVYCIYRIVTTTIAIFRRLLFSTPTNAADDTTDPITYALSLVARYIYPSLDRASWGQQISFLLSGIMLLASFSAVTQTFHLFSRFMPSSTLHATKTNFALLISQISGMYVISSALMLRGMMPKEVGSVINGALGAGGGLLEPAWVQRWFDGIYMTAVCFTTIGIFVGKQVGSSSGGFVDDDRDFELGKRS